MILCRTRCPRGFRSSDKKGGVERIIKTMVLLDD